MKYQLMELEAFRIVGVKKRMYYDCGVEESPSQEVMKKFWERVGQDGTIERLLKLNSGKITGLLGITVDYSQENNELEYWIGTASNSAVQKEFQGR